MAARTSMYPVPFAVPLDGQTETWGILFPGGAVALDGSATSPPRAWGSLGEMCAGAGITRDMLRWTAPRQRQRGLTKEALRTYNAVYARTRRKDRAPATKPYMPRGFHICKRCAVQKERATFWIEGHTSRSAYCADCRAALDALKMQRKAERIERDRIYHQEYARRNRARNSANSKRWQEENSERYQAYQHSYNERKRQERLAGKGSRTEAVGEVEGILAAYQRILAP